MMQVKHSITLKCISLTEFLLHDGMQAIGEENLWDTKFSSRVWFVQGLERVVSLVALEK